MKRQTAILLAAAATVLALGWDIHQWWFADRAARRAYHQGIDRYRRGDLAGALDDFRAAAAAQDVTARQAASYNLGTTQLHLAVFPSDGGRQDFAAHLPAAVRDLEAAVALAPDDADAVHNLAIARARLAALGPDVAASSEKPPEPVAAGAEPQPAAAGKPLPAGPSRPGAATNLAQEGIRRRTPLMPRDRVLRLLDEGRGRERLPSSALAKGDHAPGEVPEKDW